MGTSEVGFSAYQTAFDTLTEKVCSECAGLGEQNDADIGDIMYNRWPCKPCKGTGFKDGVVLRLIQTVCTPDVYVHHEEGYALAFPGGLLAFDRSHEPGMSPAKRTVVVEMVNQ